MNGWSRGEIEEIIFLLTTICCLLSFQFGYTLMGRVFLFKSLFDLYCALRYSYQEAKLEQLTGKELDGKTK